VGGWGGGRGAGGQGGRGAGGQGRPWPVVRAGAWRGRGAHKGPASAACLVRRRGAYEACYQLTLRIMQADPYALECLPAHVGAALQLGKKNELFLRGHKLVQVRAGLRGGGRAGSSASPGHGASAPGVALQRSTGADPLRPRRACAGADAPRRAAS
jgi:hypothetical protein